MKLLMAVADVPPEGDQPPAAVAAILAAATEIRVLSPSKVGPIRWLTGDIDKAQRLASNRLAEMLGRLEGVDASVTGTRGDELAGTALADALRDFAAEHVLLVAAAGDTHWRRNRVLERLLDDHGLSVTIVLV